MVILGGAGSQAGRRPRRGLIGDPARAAARSGRLARSLLLGHRPRTRRGSSASRSGSRSSLGGTFVFGLVVHSIAGAVDNAWVNGSGGAGGGVADFTANWVIVPTDPAAWVAPVSYISLVVARARPDAPARLGATCAARPRALPRRVRVGERHAREAGADAVHRPRRPPDRADDLATVRAARREARGDHLMAEKLLELQGVSMAFGGPEGRRRARSPRRRGRDRQRDRAERCGQDDAVQPRSRGCTCRPRATSCSPARASRASSRTGSRGVGSRGRSRRCACSSTCRCGRT